MPKSISEIKEWLGNPSHIRRILVEISGVTNLNGVPQNPVYLSNGAFTTSSADTPSSTSYIPRIVGGVSFTENFSIEGELSLSYGDIEIDNSEGALDYLLGYIVVNRPITIYLGDPNWVKSDYKTLFVGTVVDLLSRDRNTLNIVISDKLQKINTSLSETTIVQPAKNNIEDFVPLTFGECFNVTPLAYQTTSGATHTTSVITGNKTIEFTAAHNLLINDTLVWSDTFNGIIANQIYWVYTIPNSYSVTVKKGYYGSEVTNLTNATGLTRPAVSNAGATYYVVHPGLIESIIEVRDNGAGPIDHIPDVTRGRFKLKRQAQGQITCSVQGDKTGGVYVNTIASIIKNILTSYGPVSQRLSAATDIDNTNFSAFDSGIGYNVPVGYFTNSRQNVLNVCNQIAGSLRAKLAVNIGPLADDSSVGKVKLVRLAIDNSPTHTITASDIEQFSISVASKSEVRAATKLAYCKNWTPQSGGLATGLDATSVDILSKEWIYQYAVDNTVKSNYGITDEPNEEQTLLVETSSAYSEALSRNNLWKTPRYIYQMVCYPSKFDIQLGDCVSVTNRRFSLSNKIGTVISINRDWIGGRIEIGVLA